MSRDEELLQQARQVLSAWTAHRDSAEALEKARRDEEQARSVLRAREKELSECVGANIQARRWVLGQYLVEVLWEGHDKAPRVTVHLLDCVEPYGG
jgi:hypothetical protein